MSSHVVIGMGAVGSFLYTLLSHQGPVLGVPRVSRPKEVRIVGAKELSSHALNAATELLTSLGRVPAGSTVWLSSKAHNLPDVCRELAPKLGERTTVIVLQNGLGIAGRVRALLPESVTLVRMLCKFGVLMEAPGIVRLAGPYSATIAPVRAEPDEMAQVHRCLASLGFGVSQTSDLESAEWEKAILNLVTNPLGTILQLKNGELVARSELRELCERVAAEGLTVCRALSVSVPFQSPQDVLSLIPAVAENRNSHLVDHLRGKASDMDFLLGEFISRAKEAKVSVPIAETLWSLYRFTTRADER